MSWLKLLDIAIGIGELLAAYTARTADDKIAREARAAVESWKKVRGSKVFKAQIDEGRTTKKW